VLSLARQGLEVGIEYGPHALEAMVEIAETVEASVYDAGSLTAIPGGFSFVLLNPPLRTGAFSAVRIFVNGRAIDLACVRFRRGIGQPWRSASTLSGSVPLDLPVGSPLEVEVESPTTLAGTDAKVRIELDCPAIPPLVWLEFRDTVARR